MTLQVDPRLCFVLMPMEDPFIEVYEEVVKPAVEETGLNCVYAGDLFEPKMIMDDIWDHIERARVIIADLSGRNPNVFYEVGYGHSLDKGKVILITQQIADVPFDLRGFRCLGYKVGPRGLKGLRTKLTKAILAVLVKGPQSSGALPRTIETIGEATLPCIALENREGYREPLETRLANARDVRLLGMNLSGILSHYEAFIRERARSGCVFRVLITDPSYFLTIVSTGYGEKSLTNEIALQILERLLTTAHNMNLRFLPYPPPFSLLIIEPDQPHGTVQVESYTFQGNTSERPHFVLTRSLDKAWYDFYVREFDIAWEDSLPPP